MREIKLPRVILPLFQNWSKVEVDGSIQLMSNKVNDSMRQTGNWKLSQRQ